MYLNVTWQYKDRKEEGKKGEEENKMTWTAELWDVEADMARFHSSFDFRAAALSHRSGCNLYHMRLKVPTCIKTVGFRHFAEGRKKKQRSGRSE